MPADSSAITNELQRVIAEFGGSIEPLEPEKAVEKFLANQESEVTPNTVDEYERKLSYFIEFCNQNDVTETTEFNGRVINDFKIWRRDEASAKDGSLATKTLRDDMYLLQQFLRFLESIDAVTPRLHEKVDVPELDPDDGKRDIEFEADELDAILSYLKKFEYATREHAVWVLFAATGRRPGGLRALDCDDVHLDVDSPYVEFRNREGETRLKNADKSEQTVSIDQRAAQVLQDYIEMNRIEIERDGRSPLLTSSSGRLSVATMRKYIYKWSRPCVTDRGCPDDRNPEECEARESSDCASKCPYSKPPVALRHGYISELRRQGVSIAIISERCDVGEEIIREHYSELSEDEQRKLRRSELEKYRRSEGGYL